MASTSRPTGVDRAAPGSGDAASIQVAEPLLASLGHSTPEQQLTHVLACFQAEVSAIAVADLAAVVDTARPAFRRGVSWSAQLREQQGRSRLLVTVMHVSGAELCSESWADEASDLVGMAGLMLAMLLGIPVSPQARTAEPCVDAIKGSNGKPAVGSGQQACPDQQADASAAEMPPPVAGTSGVSTGAKDDPGLLPLTEVEISDYHRRVLDLSQAARRELTNAFREHFQVPRNARSIGDRITQRQHGAFIECFLEEALGQAMEDLPSQAAP